MILLLIAVISGQLSTPLNLNGQAIYRASCDGGITCTKSGTTLTIIGSGAAGGGGAGGAPVDGGYVVWSSVGSTNERTLSAGTSTAIDTATPGQIQVDVVSPVASATALATDPTACGAGEFVNDVAANGTLTCATPAGGSASSPLSITLGTP